MELKNEEFVKVERYLSDRSLLFTKSKFFWRTINS